jgi:hypothetical protein
VYGPDPAHVILGVVQIRSAGVPDDDGEPEPTPSAAAPPEPTGPLSYRVPGWVLGAKIGVTVLVALLTLFANDRLQLLVGVVATVLLGLYAVRDLLVRERLRADDEGVTVASGYAGRAHLQWSSVERVQVDGRMRLGARTELLEIDVGERIFQFSRFDLGVDPSEAAEAIAAVRSP